MAFCAICAADCAAYQAHPGLQSADHGGRSLLLHLGSFFKRRLLWSSAFDRLAALSVSASRRASVERAAARRAAHPHCRLRDLCVFKTGGCRKGGAGQLRFILAPINLWSVMIATDVPLLIFSFLSIVCVLQTLRSQNNAWCIAGGLCLGLAFLSKYFACSLAFSYGVYFLILSPGRASLKRLAILAAGALPFLIQNLYWNYQHGWPNLLFNLVNRNFFVTGLGYKNLLVYLLMLVYLVNPFFCWQLIRAFFSGLHGATMRSPYGPAAGSPPSLCDGDLLRPRRSPYCLRARSLC